MPKKYYLGEIINEDILGDFFNQETCETAVRAMQEYSDKHDMERVRYVCIPASSDNQAQDILSVQAHAKNCKYAAFVAEAKRLHDEGELFTDAVLAGKWLKLMQVLEISKFWQAD